MVGELATYLNGWRSYFGSCQMPSVLAELDGWIHRLRCMLWKQSKLERTRYARVRQRTVGVQLAARTAGSFHGLWRPAASQVLSIALPTLVLPRSDSPA